jgi:hypothetical protein
MGSGNSKSRHHHAVSIGGRNVFFCQSSTHVSSQATELEFSKQTSTFSGVSSTSGFHLIGCHTQKQGTSVNCKKTPDRVAGSRQPENQGVRKLTRSVKPVSLFGRLRASSGEAPVVIMHTSEPHSYDQGVAGRHRLSPPLKSLSSDGFDETATSTFQRPEALQADILVLQADAQNVFQRRALHEHEVLDFKKLTSCISADHQTTSSSPNGQVSSDLPPYPSQTSLSSLSTLSPIRIPSTSPCSTCSNPSSPQTPVRSYYNRLQSTPPSALRPANYTNATSSPFSSPFSPPKKYKKMNSSRDLSALHVYSPNTTSQRSSLKKSTSLNDSSNHVKVFVLSYMSSFLQRSLAYYLKCRPRFSYKPFNYSNFNLLICNYSN